jgi:alkylhydroperoxidase family enzyme
MSLNPGAMKGSMELYGALLHRPSPLTRAQREMLATVVAVELHCPY